MKGIVRAFAFYLLSKSADSGLLKFASFYIEREVFALEIDITGVGFRGRISITPDLNTQCHVRILGGQLVQEIISKPEFSILNTAHLYCYSSVYSQANLSLRAKPLTVFRPRPVPKSCRPV